MLQLAVNCRIMLGSATLMAQMIDASLIAGQAKVHCDGGAGWAFTRPQRVAKSAIAQNSIIDCTWRCDVCRIGKCVNAGIIQFYDTMEKRADMFLQHGYICAATPYSLCCTP